MTLTCVLPSGRSQGQLATLAHLREALGQAVRQHDGSGMRDGVSSLAYPNIIP